LSDLAVASPTLADAASNTSFFLIGELAASHQREAAAEARADRADARADAATARADAAEGRAGRAEDWAAEMRDRLDASEGRAAELRATLDVAEQARRGAQDAREAADARAVAMDRERAERATWPLWRLNAFAQRVCACHFQGFLHAAQGLFFSAIGVLELFDEQFANFGFHVEFLLCC
jgi:hypothetical protein